MRRNWATFATMAMVIIGAIAPGVAHADIVDALNLAPIVPLVLDAFMMVATGGYEFFVGNGNGIIYTLVWGFLIISVSLGIWKMFFPASWVSFFGMSGGGEIAAGNLTASGIISDKIFKPAFRAIIAAVILLQVRPVMITEWLVNPFLQFGAIYTKSITETINVGAADAPKIDCPPEIIARGWISPASCDFLIQPVSTLSHANNNVIRRGFDFITRGLRGLMTLVPHGGENLMNVMTGVILVFTFVGCNLFMALLVIQGIFNMGMALILYPFRVLMYVATPSDKWFDVWPALSGITDALKKLVVTMIACAFILCINVAVIRALFQWNSSVFSVASGGSASTNAPAAAALGVGGHALTWMTAILTFYLMYQIFDLTRKQLDAYVGGGMDKLYNQVSADTRAHLKGAQANIKKIKSWFKNK